MVSTLSRRDSQPLTPFALSVPVYVPLTSLVPTTHPRTATRDAEATQRSSVVVGEGGRSGMRQSGIHTTDVIYLEVLILRYAKQLP